MTEQDVCAKAAAVIRRGGYERLQWAEAYAIFGTVANHRHEAIAFKAWLSVEARLWPKATPEEPLSSSGYRHVDEVLAVLDREAAKS